MNNDQQDNLVNGGCFWIIIVATVLGLLIVLKVLHNVWTGQ